MIGLTETPRSAPATTMLMGLVSAFLGLGVVAHDAATGTAWKVWLGRRRTRRERLGLPSAAA